VRLVTWNCGSGFHLKFPALLALKPDVAVVQECADLDTLTGKAPVFSPAGALWTGDNRNRGLGIFSFGEYRLDPVPTGALPITYALPVRVIGPSTFNLVGLWAHHGRTPIRVAAPGPTLTALLVYSDLFRERPSINAGDFNNHVRWDRPRKASNHANTFSEAAVLGLASAYHLFHRISPGAERHPTLYWRDRSRQGPTFHIDYAFIPRIEEPVLKSVRVGSFKNWIATGLSDHAPLIVNFLPGFAARESKEFSVPDVAARRTN
jgi:exodeoxyribonuclease-3